MPLYQPAASSPSLWHERVTCLALRRRHDYTYYGWLYLLWMALLTVPGAAAHKRGSYI